MIPVYHVRSVTVCRVCRAPVRVIGATEAGRIPLRVVVCSRCDRAEPMD